MVSVAFAIRIFPQRPPGSKQARFLAETRHGQVPIIRPLSILCSKRRASLRGELTPLWLRYCMAIRVGADPDDVDDVSSLSEPHGPDGSMAVRGGARAEISQSRPARRLRQTVRTARR